MKKIISIFLVSTILTGCNLPSEDQKATQTMQAAIIQVKTNIAIQDQAVKTAMGLMKLTEIAKPTSSSTLTPTINEFTIVPSPQPTQTPQIIIIQVPTQIIFIYPEPTQILFPTPAPLKTQPLLPTLSPLETLPLFPTLPPLGSWSPDETYDPNMPLPTLAPLGTWFPEPTSVTITE